MRRRWKINGTERGGQLESLSTKSSRRIKAANICFYSALPYRAMSVLPEVEYLEGTPVETARLLHERQVDLAHIPISDYAVHGDYVGLDFGIATRCKVKGVVLFCTRPVEELKTIYVDDRSSSSLCLLRILLAQRWNLTPEIVRFPPGRAFDLFGGDIGALIIGDEAVNRQKEFPYSVDLTEEWKILTGLPFVYSLWAFRPDALNLQQCQFLTQFFHKSVQARAAIAIDSAHQLLVPLEESTEYITQTTEYHLDDQCVRGINEFFARAFELGLLPKTTYRRAAYQIGIRTTEDGPLDSADGAAQARHSRGLAVPQKRGVATILQEIVDGARLSIADGVRLASEAHLADLSLVADILRRRESSKRRVEYIMSIRGEELLEDPAALKRIGTLNKKGVERLQVVEFRPRLKSIEHYENLFRLIKRATPVKIEALSVSQLYQLSLNTKLKIEEIVTRLVFAGLDCLPANGGEILIDSCGSSIPAEQWLSLVSTFHRLGGSASASIRVNPSDTWEDRLLHLAKLRELEDNSPGFRYLSLKAELPERMAQASEVLMRATLISRVFLDNFTSISMSLGQNTGVRTVLGLSLGANRVEVNLSSGGAEVASVIELLRTLESLGMEFERHALAVPEELLLH